MTFVNIDMIIKCDPIVLNRKDVYIDKTNKMSLKKENGFTLADAVRIARQKGCLLVSETYPQYHDRGAFYLKCKSVEYTKDQVQRILVEFDNEKTRSMSYVINLL